MPLKCLWMSTVWECWFKQKRLEMPLELFSVGNTAHLRR